MSSYSSSSSFIISLLLFIAGTGYFISPVVATDHIVGANKGWNPGINYTNWANNQTFYVNDYISFRYKKFEHNVFEVNKTGYENCSTEGAIGNWTNGKDFIHLTKPGRYYFICPAGCSMGMKVSIMVHKLPPAPSASITQHSAESSKHSKNNAADGASGWLLLVVFRGLLVAFVSSILMDGLFM